MEKFEVERESSQLLPVPIPFVFGTPGGAAVDLRLFSRDIIRKALPTLVAILERETRGWFLHFRERLISELRAQKKTDEEIERVSSEFKLLIKISKFKTCYYFVLISSNF